MPTYDFPRPFVAADVAVFRGEAGAREVLLIERGHDPFAGRWALPGGFVEDGETLESAARRELLEETGLDPNRDLVQVGAYGDPGRDPRGWSVSVLFVTMMGWDETTQVQGGSDAAKAAWYPVGAHPPLAFDHDILLADALRHAAFGE
jgi:8-oxo-dGTP diphosphatase